MIYPQLSDCYRREFYYIHGVFVCPKKRDNFRRGGGKRLRAGGGVGGGCVWGGGHGGHEGREDRTEVRRDGAEEIKARDGEKLSLGVCVCVIEWVSERAGM